MSLLNMTTVQNTSQHNNDNFENTREEINMLEEEQREKTPKAQKKSKRPIELLGKPAATERGYDEGDKGLMGVIG